MERKIGEIFEYKGEWYQCLKSPDGSCKHCDMNFGGKCPIPIKECVASSRSDLSYVIFKKLEKVGKPITVKGGTFQKLILDNYSCENCVFNVQNKECYKNSYIDGPCYDNGIWVEIKQTKEDMEEKKVKPFDFEAAKAGKPVCTRDGRRARIVCFDAKGDQPIIALVEAKGNKDALIEKVERYFINGHSVFEVRETNNDLMMVSKKKEGWVNLYKSSARPTKEEAMKYRNKCNDYIDTIKISWEE